MKNRTWCSLNLSNCYFIFSFIIWCSPLYVSVVCLLYVFIPFLYWVLNLPPPTYCLFCRLKKIHFNIYKSSFKQLMKKAHQFAMWVVVSQWLHTGPGNFPLHTTSCPLPLFSTLFSVAPFQGYYVEISHFIFDMYNYICPHKLFWRHV